MKDIQDLAIRLRSILRERQAESSRVMNNAPTKVSDDLIRQQGDCYFCNEPLLLSTELKFPSVKSGPEYDKQIKLWYEKHAVRHHSHETFEYIALAHNFCNLRAVANLNIPIYFHNMGGYDGHAIIRGLSKLDGTTSVVPSTGEKFMAIDWSLIKKKVVREFDHCTKAYENKQVEDDGSWHVTFYDSFKFLNSSLEAQARILAKVGEAAFPTTRAIFEKLYPASRNSINLLYAKQVFPYNFIKSVKDLDYEGIPPQEAFHDNLRDEALPDDSYTFAKTVWNAFGIKNMAEWTMLYNLADVTILADAFCKFQKIFQEEFDIDPANYFSLPSSAWAAAHKKSKVELSLNTDYCIYQFIEAGIRGGLSCGGDIRYAKGNNPYCPDFDPGKERKFVINVDANALYPYGLSKKLPVRNFEWVSREELKKFDSEFILSLDENDAIGYFIEVDLRFDEADHDRFNAFPPAPHRRVVGWLEAWKLSVAVE